MTDANTPAALPFRSAASGVMLMDGARTIWLGEHAGKFGVVDRLGTVRISAFATAEAAGQWIEAEKRRLRERLPVA